MYNTMDMKNSGIIKVFCICWRYCVTVIKLPHLRLWRYFHSKFLILSVQLSAINTRVSLPLLKTDFQKWVLHAWRLFCSSVHYTTLFNLQRLSRANHIWDRGKQRCFVCAMAYKLVSPDTLRNCCIAFRIVSQSITIHSWLAQFALPVSHVWVQHLSGFIFQISNFWNR